MVERQGSPGAALGILVATLVVIALLGGCFMIAGMGGAEPAMIGFGVAAAVVFLGGLWGVWRVGTGYWGRRPAPDAATTPGRRWRISEPGANLTDLPGSGEVVVRLGPGARVVEVDRQEGYLQVTAPDGRTGWVDWRSLFQARSDGV
jgi:hypothetical protein